MGMTLVRLAELTAAALILASPAAAAPQAPPEGKAYGQVPGGRTSTALPGQVTRLADPAYALPSVGYIVRIINTTRSVVECRVFNGELRGGAYAIGPGAQFEFPVAERTEAITLVCPKVRRGDPLVNAQPGKRYIFRRKPVLPGGLLHIGDIDFNEVI